MQTYTIYSEEFSGADRILKIQAFSIVARVTEIARPTQDPKNAVIPVQILVINFISWIRGMSPGGWDVDKNICEK